MEGIAICIVTHDNFNEVKFCINNIIQKSKDANIRFYIFDNGTTDKRINEYCNDVCEMFALKEFKESSQQIERTDRVYLFREEQSINIYSAYNKLFKEVQEDYICVFPIGIFVNDKWHSDLFCAAGTICASGIVGIMPDFDDTYLTFLLNSYDKMSFVWKSEKNIMRGVFLIKKEIIYRIGGYNNNLIDSGFEQEELCYRVSANGLNNFYVFGQNSIMVKKDDYKSNSGKFKYNEVIQEMERNQIFKTQLT